MSEEFINLDGAEEAIDIRSDPFEVSDFPQTLVTEKIIFVVDAAVTDKCELFSILFPLKTYFSLKKKISVKPVKFECILYNCHNILHFNISSEKNLNEAIKSIGSMQYDEDTEPLKIDKLFDKIASLVELPDPDCANKCLPPNWVYHVLWLFSRNVYMPIMENTNSFDFLMMTPYFALDILYLYNKDLENNQCDTISEALLSLNENGKGYFLYSEISNKRKLISSLAQFLGHPLIRTPQQRARYNIQEFCDPLQAVNKNNDVEEQ